MNQAQSIVIVGAGMIGLSCAVALAQAGHQVTVVERGQRPDDDNSDDALPLLRVSAINHRSRAWLSQLQVWQQLPTARLGPYQAMQVWDKDSFAQIDFAANEVGADDLGAIVENAVLEQALWDRAEQVGVTIIADAQLEAEPQAALNDDFVPGQRLQLQVVSAAGASKTTLLADLLIAADGGRSQWRQRLALPLTAWDYQQQALVAAIRCQRPHQGVARQVFLAHGPLALLPLADGQQCSIVWSQDNAEAERLQALSPERLMRELQIASDNVLGECQLLGECRAFPLRMQYSRQWHRGHVVLVGDAAHTIHPLAGQGANLGLADAERLTELLTQQPLPRWGRALGEYQAERKAAALTMIAAMEAFKRGFHGQQLLPKLLRGMALQVADKVSPLKRLLTRAALGQ
ncbi:FAD-dependent oxidoreductase [Idiomarina xiamenensis]|uniref:UbiH/Coq6 family FAD-binding oxidoreductase n=1 Tax=Idiomarina xiamenensis 10-D-4 TaxID=740709 RepID=K2KIC9_9GAMM|nr:FAD-dependent oxidoreductase [Idiomarina xiamenensis]EKE87638.1 UbiH/Coq6 family FAD-binding oxidoreductase [Idiomarina xiamenensis 10-D-4]